MRSDYRLLWARKTGSLVTKAISPFTSLMGRLACSNNLLLAIRPPGRAPVCSFRRPFAFRPRNL